MAKKSAEGPSGLIVVDKPAGMTSHDVVSKMRWIAGTRKVGHAGTLDPMATGVLILGVNKATKLLTWVVGESKTYTATIRLGLSTITDDADGDITRVAAPATVEAVSEQAITEEIAKLTGDIMQMPSAVSAIKVNGVRSYARVRSGETVELDARPITVHSFDLHSVTARSVDVERVHEGAENLETELEREKLTASVLDLEVTVTCSAGTYIRALARDLGAALGTGAHLTALRRTTIGEISVEDAHSLEELVAGREAEQPAPLLPIEEAARRLFTVRQLTGSEATDLSNGRRINPSPASTQTPENQGDTGRQKTTASAGGNNKPTTAGISAAFAPGGTLVALTENTRFKGKNVAAPILVFESGKTF
ncbi:MAG: tRNA pseudouridine(55) synthase TruB [Rothia sp. (in: high G+C Gram-positive bacteria)]|nr:tRNA pseudouridine(55) synthase TruB [Rothia sp. (in: high G+C Gram-positive bacteria)]